MDKSTYYWDTKIEYLRNSKQAMYNDDYIEFLVNSVWKINKPVHLIDYGCGYGFLGLKLLPLLPEGSKYTGVDAGEALIRHAKELYAVLPYECDFMVADVQTIVLEQKYDMAISHAFVMHTPNPKKILQKMIDSVVDGGMIACFESHWIGNMSNYYFDGIDQSELIQLGPTQRLYEGDAKREGKDGNIGLKLPVYLSQLGMKQVQCRVSDRVNVIDPTLNPVETDKLATALRPDRPGDKEPFVRRLIDRGMTAEEAERQYECENRFVDAMDGTRYFTHAPNMTITFGRISRS